MLLISKDDFMQRNMISTHICGHKRMEKAKEKEERIHWTEGEGERVCVSEFVICLVICVHPHWNEKGGDKTLVRLVLIATCDWVQDIKMIWMYFAVTDATDA